MSFLIYTSQGTQYRNDMLKGTMGEVGTGRYNALNLNYWTVNNPTNDYYGPGVSNPYRQALFEFPTLRLDILYRILPWIEWDSIISECTHRLSIRSFFMILTAWIRNITLEHTTMTYHLQRIYLE